MLTGPTIILTLKVLVSAVTAIYAGAILAILLDRRKLHGRLNTVFFVLTMATVVGFEVLLRLGTDVSTTFSPEAKEALRVHLMFAVPSAVVLPVMMLSGVKRWKRLHVVTGFAFTALWIGTFVTGVFFLPHDG